MTPGSRAWILSVANALGMIGVVSFPAIAPQLQRDWGLANTEVGWLGGVYFAGYVAFVPILTGLTDRLRARSIVLAGLLISAVASAGFGLFAMDFWSATFWRFLAGVGFAGSYMPAMKALSDAVDGSARHRVISIYSASFSLGVSLSYFGTGWLTGLAGYEAAFLLLSVLPLIGILLTVISLPPGGEPAGRGMPDFRKALRNRRAIAFFVAYAVHNGESSTSRAWIVPLLAAASIAWPGGAEAWQGTITSFVAIVNIGGLFTILAAGRLAAPVGLKRLVVLIIFASACIGILLGAGMGLGPVFVLAIAALYILTVPADAGLLNSGLVSRTEPDVLGATMALHATIAFGAAFLFPVLFGLVLDLSGGEWVIAFTVLAMATMLGPLALRLLDKPDATDAG